MCVCGWVGCAFFAHGVPLALHHRNHRFRVYQHLRPMWVECTLQHDIGNHWEFSQKYGAPPAPGPEAVGLLLNTSSPGPPPNRPRRSSQSPPKLRPQAEWPASAEELSKASEDQIKDGAVEFLAQLCRCRGWLWCRASSELAQITHGSSTFPGPHTGEFQAIYLFL